MPVAAIREILGRDPRVAYALVFGSFGRGSERPDSDVDVAVGLVEGATLSGLELGDLIGRLEESAGRRVDVVSLLVAKACVNTPSSLSTAPMKAIERPPSVQRARPTLALEVRWMSLGTSIRNGSSSLVSTSTARIRTPPWAVANSAWRPSGDSSERSGGHKLRHGRTCAPMPSRTGSPASTPRSHRRSESISVSTC